VKTTPSSDAGMGGWKVFDEQWQWDLDALHEALPDQFVPLDVRYGGTKVSEFAQKTERWPATPGVLWELVQSTQPKEK